MRRGYCCFKNYSVEMRESFESSQCHRVDIEKKSQSFSVVTLFSNAKTTMLKKAQRQPAQELDLNLLAGEVTVIAGAESSGKSTLLDHWLSAASISERRLDLDNSHIISRRLNRWGGELIVPLNLNPFQNNQATTVFSYALHRLTQCSGGLVKTKRLRSELEKRITVGLSRVGMSDRTQESVHELTLADELRLQLALLYVQSPQLVVADEYTAGLLIDEAQQVLDLIKSMVQEKAWKCVLVLSNLQQVQWVADRVLVVSDDMIVFEGGPETFNQQRLLQAMVVAGGAALAG